jgi:molecular chaperone HtpG
MQLLQAVVSGLDGFISEQIAKVSEADSNTSFMEWVRRNGRYDLCGRLRARVAPGVERKTLRRLRDESKRRPLLVYAGSDASMIETVATDDTPLVVLASQNPRRQCENEYLSRFCEVDSVSDAPRIISQKPEASWSLEEQGIVFRVATILASDYFLPSTVLLGTPSHGLAILADLDSNPVQVVLNPEAPTFNVVRELYKNDYSAFSSMIKDFVRTIVFPKVADRVPSSTKEGAEAFLKTIRRTKDVFEYEYGDLGSLDSVWFEYLEGRLSMEDAVRQSTAIVQRNVQVVDRSAAQAIRDVVPDVIANEEVIGSAAELDGGALPAIIRDTVSSEAKLLTIPESDTPLRGYRCFIALSDRTRDERGDFFLQPHATSIVWGGQKVLFVFEHHSGEFGLYYDLQTNQVVATESGGGPYPTSTIILRNRIFIPIPESIMTAFIPAMDEKKRFDVRADLLFTDET